MWENQGRTRNRGKLMAAKITAPKGTQDFFPPRTLQWQALEAFLHRLSRRYGYGEMRTPIFERTELFVRGVGDTTDIVEKEMFTFLDKAERSMSLRPEWTAPVVRAAIEHNLLQAGAARFYYIGPMFRYENVQAGRYRQAHQFGVECLGYTGPEADSEVISLIWETIAEYKLTNATLNINTIGDDACRPRYREALLEYLRPHREALSTDSQRRLERNPFRILDSKEPQDIALVQGAPTFESMLCQPCRDHFATLRAYLDAASVPYVVNPQIVRGLDYYTRTVFEITSDALGAQSTVCGGGRYDGLVKALGGPNIPGVGFAMGIERFLMMVDAVHGVFTPERDGLQAIALGAQARSVLVPLVAELRGRTAMPVFMDFEERKLLAHLKTADRNNARFALIVGSEELQGGEAVLRDLEARSDRRVPLGRPADLAAVLGEAKAP